MGDSRRFDLFSKCIQTNFPLNKYTKVADIAGGKGYLNLALKEKGYNVKTFDKRYHHIKVDFKYGFFNKDIDENFDLIVGMHPDEATDHIIVEAAKRKVPFVVCPCCIKPDAVMFNDSHNFSGWIRHLKGLAYKFGYSVTETQLKMTGKNLVLIGRPINIKQ